ncbi:serine/threonine protein kinase [Actinomycetaceae bacterium TAE3-ERU4]|nr:serine/threonine protein kinase [Actinomycetaceae bacterium TAE3-ERU4]
MAEIGFVGGYRLLSELGRGASSVVFLAQDEQGNEYALKLLHPTLALDIQARERLEREARLINSVRDVGVARVYDYEIDSDQPFIVTDLVSGPTLERAVTQRGPMALRGVISLGRKLARTLQAVHEAGVVHRDFKPSNVALSPHGPVLLDFGVSQAEGATRMTSAGLVSGTAGYVPAEVLRGQEPSRLADWWAWCATLLFARSGKPPFGAGAQGQVLSRVLSGQVLTEGLSADEGCYFSWLLSLPLDSLPDFSEVLDSLERIEAGQWDSAEIDDDEDVELGQEETEFLESPGTAVFATGGEEYWCSPCEETLSLPNDLDSAGDTELLSEHVEEQAREVPTTQLSQSGWGETSVASSSTQYLSLERQSDSRFGIQGGTGIGEDAERTCGFPFQNRTVNSSIGLSEGLGSSAYSISDPNLREIFFEEEKHLPALPRMGLVLFAGSFWWMFAALYAPALVLVGFTLLAFMSGVAGQVSRERYRVISLGERFGIGRLSAALLGGILRSLLVVGAGMLAALGAISGLLYLLRSVFAQLGVFEFRALLYGVSFSDLSARPLVGFGLGQADALWAICILAGLLVFWLFPPVRVVIRGRAVFFRMLAPSKTARKFWKILLMAGALFAVGALVFVSGITGSGLPLSLEKFGYWRING